MSARSGSGSIETTRPRSETCRYQLSLSRTVSATRELPREFVPLAAQALNAYRSEPGIGDDLDVDEVRRFSKWVEAGL